MPYSLEQAQTEASLITEQLTTDENGGVFTHEEYDIAQSVVDVQIIAFPGIVNRLADHFKQLVSQN